jgi:Amt family ammonium transporter
MSSTFLSWILLGKPDLGMTINGCLAGLVAITAPCAFVSIGSSIIIGLVAGLLVVVSVIFFDRIRIDDPVGALSVHLANGVFGTLCVGLFAQDKIAGVATGNGLFYGGGTKLFFTQLTGVFSVAAYTFIISFIAWSILKLTMGIRVSLQEEIDGLDIGEHGNSAYPEFLGRKPSYSFLGFRNIK